MDVQLTCKEGVVTVSDEQAHQVAVPHCVNGLDNDLIEGQGRGQLLLGDCLHPVHPVTGRLVEQVVMHTSVLNAGTEGIQATQETSDASVNVLPMRQCL